ncbi:hypothetical protein Tco_0775595 [Tanacetum coccineum]
MVKIDRYLGRAYLNFAAMARFIIVVVEIDPCLGGASLNCVCSNAGFDFCGSMTNFIIVVVEIDSYHGRASLDCVLMAWGSFVGDDAFTAHAVFDAALSIPTAACLSQTVLGITSVFQWLGVLLMVMILLLCLCIYEFAITIGCWIVNIVITQILAGKNVTMFAAMLCLMQFCPFQQPHNLVALNMNKNGSHVQIVVATMSGVPCRCLTFICYLNRKRETRKFLNHSIDVGPYELKAIQLDTNEHPRRETKDDLTGDALKQYDTNIEGTALSMVDRETQFNNEFDQVTVEPGESLVSVYNHFSQLMNDLKRNKIKLPTVTINTKFLNCLQPEWINEKGHYARNYPKPRVRVRKYFMEQMLLEKKDEAGVILSNEQKVFLVANVVQMEELEELKHLARIAYKEAEKQQIIANKVNQQNVELIKQLEQYKEKVRVFKTNKATKTNFHTEFIEVDRKAKRLETEFQNQYIRDRDKIRDLEKERDDLQLNVSEQRKHVLELQNAQTILKRKMNANEDKYLDDVLNLEAKLKKNENV